MNTNAMLFAMPTRPARPNNHQELVTGDSRKYDAATIHTADAAAVV
jgi:hypothetical protein